MSDISGSTSPFHAFPGPDAPVYVISVAAELTGLHPQTLRAYDRLGLVRPGRAGGGGRRYSWRDIELLREVADLTAAGIGLEGVRRILELEHQARALRERVVELEAAHAELKSVRDNGDARSTRRTSAGSSPGSGSTQYGVGQGSVRNNLPVVRSTGKAVMVWRRGRIF